MVPSSAQLGERAVEIGWAMPCSASRALASGLSAA